MKRFILLFCMMNLWQAAQAEAVSFAVPKQCLENKDSLVLLMVDGRGQECVGTCQLHEQLANRVIVKEDLQIKQDSLFGELSDSIDVTNTLHPCDHEVLLHIEFDRELKVLKILVVQDSLFAENPFDVLSIAVQKNTDEVDELSMLLDDVDCDEVIENMPTKQLSRLEEYKLYLEVYIAMQYSSARRKVDNLISWFFEKK